MPTSAGAILHHTDQKGPNILKGSVRTPTNTLSLGQPFGCVEDALKLILDGFDMV